MCPVSGVTQNLVTSDIFHFEDFPFNSMHVNAGYSDALSMTSYGIPHKYIGQQHYIILSLESSVVHVTLVWIVDHEFVARVHACVTR